MKQTSATQALRSGHPFRKQVKLVHTVGKQRDDLKLFALSFTAFFICTYALIF